MFLIAVGFITAYSFQSTANAAFPKLINFQGKLTAVSNGTNVANGTYTFQFKIYDAPTGGSLLWTETYDQAPVDDCQELQVTSGVFNTKLGSCNPLTIDVTAGDLYLSVNFDPGSGYDGEMTPRKQLVASAFAFNANNVVGDGRIDIAYAPGTTTNPGAKIDYAPSVSSSNNALQVSSGANVTGAALVVTQAGTGVGINLAGAGGSSRIINSTSSALILQTTTSGNINLNSAGGTLELQDNTNVTGALTATGVIQGGSATATTYSRLGTGTTNHSLGAADDLLITDDLEVDGDSFFDGNITITGSCTGCGGGSQTPWAQDIDADNFSLLDFGPNLTSRAATTIGSANNGAGASGLVTLNTGTGTTSTGGVTLATGNASAGTAGNISLDVGTSTSGNGSILIGTAARAQTVTIGNSTGGTITVGASSGSDLILNDAHWSVTGAGVASFITGSVLGSQTFTTNNITDSGALTVTSGATTALTLNSGTTGTINVGTDASAETINIGNTGAAIKTIAIGNNSQANTITIGDASATSVSITENNWSINSSGVAAFITGSTIGSQTFTTNNITDSGALTVTSGATTALTLNSGTTGTINIGTDASAETINIGNTGAAVKTIAIGNNSQANTITIGDASATGVSITDNNWSVSTAGVASFITGSTIGSLTFTTNNISDSGALTINSTSGALTLQSTTSGNIVLNSAGGTIELQDNTNVTGAITATGAIQGGGATAVAYSRLGAGTTTHSLGAADDLLITDDLEVDGDAFFDGNLTVTGTCTGCGGGSQTPWAQDIDADNFSLLDFGPSLTSRAATTIGSANNGAGASGLVTLNTGTGTTSTGGVTLVTGNASAGTAGSISLDVGTSTSGNGSILIGTAARTQTITIGNSTGGVITVGASSGSDLVLNDAQWSVSGAGAALFASADVSGVIQAGSSNVNLTDASGFVQHDSIVDCADTQILKWATGGGRWGCATDETGGGGSTLQSSYAADVDDNNATISLTTADDSLVFTNPSSSGTDSAFVVQVDQANTTAAVVGLDIVQQSDAANAVNVTANAINAEVGLNITANALTSGNGLAIASSSTALTGALAKLTLSGSNAANTGSLLRIDNTGTASATTGLYIDHRATGTGNYALRIDDVSGDTTPFIVDGDGRVGIGTSSISANAATERLLQVGSETERGNASVYGEIISKGLDDHTPLTGIKDVFVYDTTGDSDGGRWIDWATTDNLSWYAEALDDSSSDPCVIASDDRCYKASFPRKAILVVTTDALYIFDAATNDMWMKFSQNASVYALGADTNNDPSSVFALNGVIYVGANGSSAGGLYAFDFVNDRMWNYNGTNRSAATTGISGRNAATTYNVESNLKLEISPVGTAAEWERVNDVHAVVMSRTQSAVTALGSATNTNPAYGKVFIGLATDSGITLINPSGFVLHQYSDVTADDYTSVVVSSRGFLYALNTTQDQLERWDTIDTDKASEVNGTYSRKWDETIGTGPALASATFNILAGAPDNLEIAERASNNLNTEDVIYVGHSLGMAELHEHTTQAFGWVKYYNSTRQTPMMMLAGINDMVLPMDDTSGTQAQDLAIANTDMAIKGTPTLGVDGVQGKAINFDNTDDYLCSDANQDNTCDLDTAFNMSTVGWTISLWFKHSATAPSGAIDTIFEKCVTATPGQAVGCVFAYMNTSGQIVVANDDDATWTRPDGGGANSYDITATSTYAYNDNQWHNLIITRTNINDVDSWIDGQGMSLSTATGNTITLDGSQIVTLGASCVTTVTANCGAVTNVWDGQLDDVQFIVGTTTQATMTQLYVRRYFNVERPRVTKKTITVTDATSATSTSLTDTGEAWNANEFAGAIVEITGSSDTDCVGVSRRVSSNTATSLTFTPAVPGACTMDTSADFEVDSEALFGGSSSVGGIGISAETPLGEARQMCVGTNSGSDTGAVTCYNHQDGPSIVADVYHSQASQTDNSGTDWTGSNYDEMIAIDLSTRTLVMASEAHFTSITEDVRLGQGLDYIANQLYNIRQEIVLDGITAIGSTGSEIGFTGGADLAEYYYSTQALEPGQVVVIDREGDGDDVVRSTRAYSGGILGVVSTQPGIILGLRAEDGFPIALTGRIPVKFSMENGPVKAGDYLTSSSIPGYAMRATGAGPTIGKALADSIPEQDMAVCSAHGEGLPDNIKCSEVSVFVEHGNFSGLPIEQLMQEMRVSVSAVGDLIEDSTEGLVEESDEESQALVGTGLDNDIDDSLTTDEKILVFLKHIKAEKVAAGQGVSAELFTDRVSAAFEVISPQVTTSGLRVEVIGKLGGIIDMLSDVTFFGRPYLNNDTAGFAVIKEGHTTVDVKFDKEYIEQPVVVASIAGELDSEIIKTGDVEKIKEIQKLQDDLAIELFEQGIQALVIKKNVFGFTILLNKPAPKDLSLSWIALAVKNPKIFESEGLTEEVEDETETNPEVLGENTSSDESGSSEENNESSNDESPPQEEAPVEEESPPAEEPAPPVEEQAEPSPPPSEESSPPSE